MNETWLITHVFVGFETMDEVILSFIKPEVEILEKESLIRAWHFFREQELSELKIKRPYLLFRVCGDKEFLSEKLKPDLERRLQELKENNVIDDYRVEENPGYTEEGSYGKDGWPIAQKLFEYTSKVALFILDRRKKKISLPSNFHEEKIVHCFLNQSRGTYAKEIEFYVTRLEQLSVFPDLPIVADQNAAEFNARYLTEPEVINELSTKLCDALDQKVPYVKDGRKIRCPPENLMWAIELVASAWIGWVLESKAIEHYGKPHPEMREILMRAVIPSVAGSFNAGRRRAMKERGIR